MQVIVYKKEQENKIIQVFAKIHFFPYILDVFYFVEMFSIKNLNAQFQSD